MRGPRLLPATVGALVLVAAACTGDSSGSSQSTEGPRSSADLCFEKGKPFEGGEARLYIEHNATDRDTGVHGAFSVDGLSEGCVSTPDGTPLLYLGPAGRLDKLGINDFTFESREPPNAEYPVSDLKADFPEGEYHISGVDYEGTRRVATARFTHAIPKAPVIVQPRLVAEEKASSNTVPSTDLTVRWEPVTRTIDGEPVTISAYELIVTKVEHDDPHALSRPVYDVHVPPETTRMTVPDGFLEPKTLYELEVLALEDSGNQTITVGFFSTR